MKTAGSWLSWVTIGGLAAGVVLLQPSGCKGPNKAVFDADVEALLGDVGPLVVVPTLRRFDGALQDLRTAADDYLSTIDDDPSKSEVQAAWSVAMSIWQEAEVLQIGPSASSLTAVEGESLSERVYSWPDAVNPCRVDQETVAREYQEDNFTSTRLVNVLGMDALEHLIYAGPDNACPGQIDINADGTWDALGDLEVRRARAEYAVALIDDLIEQVDVLNARWAQFTTTLRDAGAEGSPYEDQSEGLNAVFDAIFYLEVRTKERKLGQPMGVSGCAEVTCADDVEGALSGGSTEWIAANLKGFRALFTGGEGQGLDDLMRTRGHGDITDDILNKLDAADAAALALERPVDAALTEDPEGLQALYDAIDDLNGVVKGDLATVLSLRVPSEAAGDLD